MKVNLPVINNQIQDEFSFQSIKDIIRPIYFDNNSTTVIDEDALIAIVKALEIDYGNPSAHHQYGRNAKKLINEARQNVANYLGCKINEVIFTSGATEAINTVINSVICHSKNGRIISCKTEHSATINKLEEISEDENFNIVYLDVDNEGRFELSQLKQYLDYFYQYKNLLVSLVAANNETGTIHKNLSEAINLTHQYGALFHIDAAQIVGKVDIKEYMDMCPDFLSFSGHKIHAAKGVGVLYVRETTPLHPLILGGNQENKLRSGTENVPGIVSLGVVLNKKYEYPIHLRTKFIELLKAELPEIIINGGDLWNTVNVGFPYIHREAMVYKLSEYGILASTGSSCSKGIKPSHILAAMKVDNKYINGSVRFSFSKYTTDSEIEKSIGVIVKAYKELRSIAAGIC